MGALAYARRRDPEPLVSLVSWALVEESLDEAEFLWSQREAALGAPDESPDQVESRIEERLLGAIEGICVSLGVAGKAGVARLLDLLVPALASDQPSMVAVAGHALLAGGSAEGSDCFADAFARASGKRLEALRRGLELIDGTAPYLDLVALSRGAPDPVRAAFLDACAFRGLPLEPGVGPLVTAASHELQRAAARLLRHAPSPVIRAWLPRALTDGDRHAREAAVETGLILGVREAWPICRELAEADLCGSARLLVPLAISASSADHDIVLRALQSARRQRDAVWALGFGGRRSGADACVDLLARECHVPLAAEAFCAITGLDLAGAGLAVAPAPAPDEPPSFEEDDLERDLAPQAEDRLPHPDISGVIRWWNKHRARFDPAVRYLAGRPTGLQGLRETLANGPMRRRPPIALELAMRTQGRVQVETQAFIFQQRARWAAAADTDAAKLRRDRSDKWVCSR